MDQRLSPLPLGSDLNRASVPIQFIWYLLVGGLSFLADLAIFAALTRYALPVWAALVVGFVVGTGTNYSLSLALAFTGGRHRRTDEILRLIAVAVAGLLLTALLVWGFIGLGLSALSAKVLATPIVLVWNYGGRRLFVFQPQMPFRTWLISLRLISTLGGGLTRREDMRL
jgi:putative flippase GtrA